MGRVGWGKWYSSGAQIKTSGTGSLDSTSLSNIKDLKCARQLLTYGDAESDNIKKTLCRTFRLISYVDNNGYECIEPYDRTSASGTLPVVQFSDMTGKPKINDPDLRYIYPEPIVRYNINSANGDYQSLIEITNVSASTYNSSYVRGLDGADAQEYWERCQALWQKSRHIETPPRELTDLQWANGNVENADEIATWYIKSWIDSMLQKYVTFRVHFLHQSNSVKTREWFPGQHFNLTLPHETNSNSIECIATKISIPTESPYLIDITAVMIGEDAYDTFGIQEVWYTVAEGADKDIQEDWDTVAEGSIKDVQEVT